MQCSPAHRLPRPAVPPPRTAGCVPCILRGRPVCVCGGIELASATSIHYVLPDSPTTQPPRVPLPRPRSGGSQPGNDAGGAPTSLPPAPLRESPARSGASETDPLRRSGAHRRRRRRVRRVLPSFLRRRGRPPGGGLLIGRDKSGRHPASVSMRWRARMLDVDQTSSGWAA